jgi:hypothetical protein
MKLNKKKFTRPCIKSLFANLHYKLNFSLKNTSSFLLATDLLRDNIKRKLFKIVTTNVEVLCLDPNINGSIVVATDDKALLLNLIKSSLEHFLISCYGNSLKITPTRLKDSFYTKYLLEETNFLLIALLDALQDSDSNKFHLLFAPIYDKPYARFIESFIENLVIEICNAVTYLIIREFSFIYDIRKNFYRSNFLSLRNIERFKNNLSWQTRLKAYVQRPSDIYNSQYSIWVFRRAGIQSRIIYANRGLELVELRQLPLITLVVIEAKDFFISRFDELFNFFGNGLRYTLTSVIGQVIGLVWRGVIEGLKKP